MITMIRTFTELSNISSFDKRYEYLKVIGSVGRDVFGEDRYLNQQFYRSEDWRKIRDRVIVRDQGLDLGCRGYEILGNVIVHHMNPITVKDITCYNPDILDPEFLISTSLRTHLAIHYGDKSLLPPRLSFERKPGDTKLW
jgi:hypothetical protein